MPDTQTEIQLFDRGVVPDGRRADISAMNIRPHHATVSDAFVDNIRRLGVLEPVLLRESEATHAAPYRIIDGHRRIAAMRIIDSMRPIPAIIYPHGTPLRVLGAMALSTNIHRTPNAVQEWRAIQELMETGATIPQIAASLSIPEATIIARLRVGNLEPHFMTLLQQGRLSASLAQRLGAETLQTRQRIWREFEAAHLSTEGDARLTTAIAYPQRPQDEQIRLLPSPVDAASLNALPIVDIVTMMDDTHKAEFMEALLRVMQPDSIATFFERIPSQTLRELYRRVFNSTVERWFDFADTEIPLNSRLGFASAFIVRNSASQFISGLTTAARDRVREFYRQTFNLQQAQLQEALDTARAEIARQQDRYRVLETLVQQRQTAATPRTPTEPAGRAYRQNLEGPSDDPAERGISIPGVDAISGAQFDYQPIEGESWGAVVIHLTDAADALPLSPSDECDRFHIDVEALRTRAIEQERLENANAGVVSGTVIPPPPAPSETNRPNVRTLVDRPPRVSRAAASSLAEHAALLTEQAEQINANTTPRTPRDESAMRPLVPPRRVRPPRRETSVRPETRVDPATHPIPDGRARQIIEEHLRVQQHEDMINLRDAVTGDRPPRPPRSRPSI